MAVNVERVHGVPLDRAAGKPCDIVVGGLDRTQSLPLPVHFATTGRALGARDARIARARAARLRT
jgi:hypothetical protein